MQQSLSTAWKEEENFKEALYSYFEKKISDQERLAKEAEQSAADGGFDDKDGATIHSEKAKQQSQRLNARQKYRDIMRDPYFAHMEETESDGVKGQYMLSRNPSLDTIEAIGRDIILVPFVKDPQREMLTFLLERYYSDKADSASCRGIEYTTTLKRNVTVENRRLISVNQLYPESSAEGETIDADELLEKLLDENRSDATLKNIIATLQTMQFDIIRQDEQRSFVVQGCAGSGKTQCLLHRLLYLRDILGVQGWDKVLLITPTQLFRNYASDLMRSYNLTHIRNNSLAFFYRDLLGSFDERFKNRQYRFELTEEYLPDGYLRDVYAPAQMRFIRENIQLAISNRATELCRLLKIPLPEKAVTIELFRELAERVDKEILAFDEREAGYSESAEYRYHMDELDVLDKRAAYCNRRLTELNALKAKHEDELAELEKRKKEEADSERELKEWMDGLSKSNQNLRNRFNALARKLQSVNCMSRALITEYLSAFAEVTDSTESWGFGFKRDRELHEYYCEYIRQSKEDYAAFLAGQTEAAWRAKFNDRVRNNSQNIKNAEQELSSVQEKILVHSEWIKDYTDQEMNLDTQRNAYRAELVKVKSALTRLESDLFEQTVWHTLEPLKDKHSVQAVYLERQDDGRQKQTRILYKADLLFYLMIYEALYPKPQLPELRLICIDEGQDLHPEDYTMLRRLYPNTPINVFGDTEQVLHEEYGVSDWRRDTGIENISYLKTNYRNTAALVRFCQEKFSSEMQCIGSVKKTQIPLLLHSCKELEESLKTKGKTLIVKDYQALSVLCVESGFSAEQFEYLDTRSEATEHKKIPCYSVFAAKGLEFPEVIVFTRDMSRNQKLVACTRAMERLSYYL